VGIPKNRTDTALRRQQLTAYLWALLLSSSSSSFDNGADSIPSNIAPRVNKQMCIEKAVQQTMNSNFE